MDPIVLQSRQTAGELNELSEKKNEWNPDDPLPNPVEAQTFVIFFSSAHKLTTEEFRKDFSH